MVGSRSFAKCLIVTAFVAIAANALATPAVASDRLSQAWNATVAGAGSTLGRIQVWLSRVPNPAQQTKDGAALVPGGKPIVAPSRTVQRPATRETNRHQ